MIVTLTEMGDRVYVADVDGQRERLTQDLRDRIQASGILLWKTDGFGHGKIGNQAQYELDEKGESNDT